MNLHMCVSFLMHINSFTRYRIDSTVLQI